MQLGDTKMPALYCQPKSKTSPDSLTVDWQQARLPGAEGPWSGGGAKIREDWSLPDTRDKHPHPLTAQGPTREAGPRQAEGEHSSASKPLTPEIPPQQQPSQGP